MVINPFLDIFEDGLVIYEDLGDIENGGESLDDLIDMLKLEIDHRRIFVSSNTKMTAFILGADECFYPLFPNETFNSSSAFDYDSLPDGASIEGYSFDVLDVYIIEQISKQAVCHLCYRYEELSPEGWEVVGNFTLPRNDIIPFIQLARRIQNAKIE